MNPFIVGLAGGSGAGKSTLAFGLEDSFPGECLILHVDDYFKPEAEVPVRQGMVNWDDPEALYHEKMANDLTKLKSGQPATINTKSPRLNPDFIKTGKRIPVEISPKPLIVVEGFLTLHLEQVRQLLDLSIYLDGPFELQAQRRVHGKIHKFPPEYDEQVLLPMHEKYVVPSKAYADYVLDTSALSKEQALDRAVELISHHRSQSQIQVTTD